MFIICNGAFKSGSTWLFNMLRFTLPWLKILPEYQDKKAWRGESIAESALSQFLREVDYLNQNYIIKSHYYNTKTRDLLIKYKSVYIFNIKRDIRDVIVSSYYHYKREENLTQTFEEYYWQRGRELIWYLNDYHSIWAARKNKIYVSSYECLLDDFANEAQRIFGFLNYDLKPNEIESLKKRTTMEEFRKLWGEDTKPDEECFFRKGIVGDWQSHFTQQIEADYNKIQRKEALKKGGKLWHFLKGKRITLK